MTKFTADIAEKIWNDKYRFVKGGEVVDQNVSDTWLRAAEALSLAEKDFRTLDNVGLVDYDNREFYEEEFYRAMEDWKFIPAGRIVAGAGTGRDVTLFNCFVMGTVPDNMAGIFDMLKEAALTMQKGGGIGYDFSTIRPEGSLVVGVDADASGPLSFMDVWDSMCRTIMSAGSRRGAMMATIRCDHPDVFKFIKAKRDPLRLRMFNMSVLITDDFIDALEADGDFDLHFNGEIYETVRAADLWDAIMESTYNYAEPGVIFIDRINKTNNLAYCEDIAATNPCGEQPLPPYGACLLGSINLARFVDNPFEDIGPNGSQVMWDDLARTTRTAVRMLDNVVDVSKFPLPAQEEEAKNKRRIGLGVTGLADMLIMLKVKYGSDKAVEITNDVLSFITNEAYLMSAQLAGEKGAFPLYDEKEFAKAPILKRLDVDVQKAIKENGIRNALLTSIAPTGTISLYAGNVSSGIEPVFSHSYTRKILNDDGSHTEALVEDYAVALYREKFGKDAELPDYFVSAQTLKPIDHVVMQAVAQKWIDSSISKTINCPEDIDFETFKDVYRQAYKLGCKGCTTYRPNDVTGSVLTVSDDSTGADDSDAFGGACTLEVDPESGQLIRTCE